MAAKKPDISFSGSGTPHQNWFAERAIGIIQNMARTMMIHAAMQSPEGTITAELWPMTMDYACWLYNNIPQQDSGFTPFELWSRSTFQPTQDTLSLCRDWGAPRFVLEPKLQKGGIKIPKWAARSCRGLFMGFSLMHAATVG